MPNGFYAVIMAGGSGKRFWPLSRHNKPKQLLKLLSEKSLLQETVERLMPLFKPAEIFVITNKDQAELVHKDISNIPKGNIFAEPVGRDTAACIGFMATYLEWLKPDSTFVALPADQYIHPKDKFHKVLTSAYDLAQKGYIVTVGMKPTYPATAYGYLQKGETLGKINGISAYKLRRFCEKPDQKVANKFVESREFYWNGGTFTWSCKNILANIKKFMPELAKGLDIIKEHLGKKDADEIIRREYQKFRSISIDFGIMERADKVAIIEADFVWEDVGSLVAVAEHKTKDVNGNVIAGICCGLDNKDAIIFSGEKHLIGAIGLKDLVIVHTDDATLICPKERLGDLKKLVENIGEKGLTEFL